MAKKDPKAQASKSLTAPESNLSLSQKTKNAAKFFGEILGFKSIKPDAPAVDDVKNYVKKPSKNLDEALRKSAKTGTFDSDSKTEVPLATAQIGSKIQVNVAKPNRRFWSVVGWIAWLVFAFFAAQFFVALPLVVMQYTGHFDATNMTTLGTMLLQAAIYGVMAMIAIGGPWLLREKLHLPKFRALIGIDRRPQWRDAGYALATTPIYYGILLVIATTVTVILTVVAGTETAQEIMGQAQDISFAKTGNSPLQLAAIFLAFVVIAPLFEEALTRGLLFGRLRKILSFWPTAILVSLTFAVAHGQINVAIDTFILSMIMCYVREKTGTIWGTVLMHMIKNGIAFTLLFLVTIPGVGL